MKARHLLPWILLGACASRQHMNQSQQEGEKLRFELAQAYVDKGAWLAADPLLRRLVKEFPKEPYVRVLYGITLRERGIHLGAEREFKAAIAVRADYAAAWAGLGITYDMLGRSAEAVKVHRKAIKLAPENADYWNNLGFSLYAADRADEAIEALQRALELDPSLVVAHNNLGFAYGKRRRYDQAWRSFRAALDDAGAAHNLALVYEQNGEVERARELRGDPPPAPPVTASKPEKKGKRR
jgi:Flp pilus assembly protein TadD